MHPYVLCRTWSESYVACGVHCTVSFPLSLSELIPKLVAINQESQTARGEIHTSRETYVASNFPAKLYQIFSIFLLFSFTVFDSWKCRYTKFE